MASKKGSPKKEIAKLAPTDLSETEAADVRGGASSSRPTVSPTAPTLKPIVPRSIDPCW